MKTNKEPRIRAKKSFLTRYGMTRAEWTNKKRELRKEGKGFRITEIMTRAYERFVKGN